MLASKTDKRTIHSSVYRYARFPLHGVLHIGLKFSSLICMAPISFLTLLSPLSSFHHVSMPISCREVAPQNQFRFWRTRKLPQRDINK